LWIKGSLLGLSSEIESMEKASLKRDMVFWVMGVLSITTCLTVWLGDQRYVGAFTEEDGVVESLSAVFYFFGFAGCIWCLFRKRGKIRLWLVIWAFFCLVFLGEETSWFQRIIGYTTPEFLESMNAQDEVNIHNLGFFQGGKWTDGLSSGRFDVKMLLGSQNLFRIGFACYFLLIPLLLYWGKPRFFTAILIEKLKYPVPKSSFMIPLWTTLFLSFFLSLHSTEPVKASLAETRELFYALFILFYLFTHVIRSPGSQQGKWEGLLHT
jgi:hypothetical protein